MVESGIEGIFLVSKPVGITSHDVVDRLRAVTHEKRIGHAGTLDPLASGLLVVAIGRRFTKHLEGLRKLSKEYVATVVLGKDSTTYDAEGEITPVSNYRPDTLEIKNVLAQLTGSREQIPPKFSAKKIRGQKAYQLARRGEAVELPPQLVVIYALELIEYRYPMLRFRAVVSSGTYIRSLAHDIGQSLSTGAYLDALIRTRIGEHKLESAAELDKISSVADLADAKIELRG
ncbi:tRNA pseudouridine(55) synthase TruB [candidate division Kazan bacterium RBG_13_50_9]|uniref:tRNA pseudouridine synthase B n=1 Tax=candidate division Kazan bacterium RBG_13_50_9 TaxID=1798535 RepID=A0A1F4NRQ8_UNCK3|nr:MAG: tRNA pseudouridine(55) synthase TruB [candidate division Kazan bacterium RBG_13_50_9]